MRISDWSSDVCSSDLYEPAALDYAKKKANVRVLKIPHGDGRNNVDVKRVGSGLLLQHRDNREVARDELKVAGKRAPRDAELHTLLFAWTVPQHVKSNAIVYAHDQRPLGIAACKRSRGLHAEPSGLNTPHTD